MPDHDAGQVLTAPMHQAAHQVSQTLLYLLDGMALKPESARLSRWMLVPVAF